MEKRKITTVNISYDTWRRLIDLKESPNDSMERIIIRLIEGAKK